MGSKISISEFGEVKNERYEVLDDIDEGLLIVLAIILIIGGVIVGLFGGKLHKLILFLLGFIAGAFSTYLVLEHIGINQDSEILHYSMIIVFVIGICTGFLALCLYRVSLFVIGAIAGIVIQELLWHLITERSWFPDIPNEEIYDIVTAVVFAVFFGILSLYFAIMIVIPLTAFIGSFMITSGAAYFIQKYAVKKDNNFMQISEFFGENNECGKECWVFFGVWIVLFLIALLYQHYQHRPCYSRNRNRNSNINGSKECVNEIHEV